MVYHTPHEVAQLSVDAGVRKTKLPLSSLLILGFLSGAFIALGFLLDIRVSGNVPREWGSFAGFLGASVFPLGLILSIIAGGELLTGNMMTVTMAKLAGRISWGSLLKNWFWVTISNFVGAVFVAYMFGHVAGMTAEGPFLVQTAAIAHGKVNMTFIRAFVSGIGCNWLVGLAVWLSYTTEEVAGKILGIWFAIMGFVAIGFQHVVANMFVIPAAIFAGQASWWDWLRNFVPVLLGNGVGGAIFVALFYWYAYLRAASDDKRPARE